MNVAFIPVRGGSKSIPLKNIKIINGKPLVYWVIKAAAESKSIDHIYISTDSFLIRDTVNKFEFDNFTVIKRNANTATDTAPTEAAMLEFANSYDFDNIFLIQATSPLLTANDLDEGYRLFLEKSVDSVLSVVRQKRFNWELKDGGNAFPINYNPYNRPRRQEFPGYLTENGAFYITSKENLLNSGNRISGNIKTYEMPEDTFFEIDEPSDWIIIEQLMKNRSLATLPTFKNIKMFLTDCDGCLTDGGMYYTEKGDEAKRFNTRDGMGFELLKKQHIITGIVTSENTEIVRRRAKKLNVDELCMGVHNKLDCIKKLCIKQGILLEEVLYIGDDINDLEAVACVGIGCCVANATEVVKRASKYITKNTGGNGAIREIVDILLND